MNIFQKRDNILELAITIMVSLALGLYILSITSLSFRMMLLFILGILFLFGWMIVGNIRGLLLALIILDTPLKIDIHFFYQYDLAAIGALGGLNLSLTTICLALLYLLWIGSLFTRSTTMPPHMFKAVLPLMSYLFFVCISLFAARNIFLALYEFFLLFQMFLLFLYIVGTVRSREEIILIITLLIISMMLEGIIMVYLRVVGHSFSFPGTLGYIDPRSLRVGGTVGSPINAANFLTMVSISALGVFLTRLGKSYKFVASAAFCIGVGALILTKSRGGWIGLVFCVSLLFLLAWKRKLLPAYLPIIMTIISIVIMMLFHETILTRIFGDDGGSASDRLPLMKLAFSIIKDHPLLGVGANNFAVMIEEYTTKGYWGAWLYTVHNKYLLVWSELGLGGLLAYIWFLLSTLKRGWTCWQGKDNLLSPLALSIALAVVACMIHMLVDMFHSRPPVQLLTLSAALITSMALILREEKLSSVEVKA
jgi:O-antigen ligase